MVGVKSLPGTDCIVSGQFARGTFLLLLQKTNSVKVNAVPPASR